jgi:prepilin-type N-terminal cleavage/methylation domain-containing protein
MQKTTRKAGQAFSLSELIVAMTVLAIMVTFNISKILNAQSQTKSKSLMKETISTMSSLYVDGVKSREFTLDVRASDFVLSKVNAVKVCPNNSITEGCFPQGFNGGNWPADEAGFILSNGVTVSGIDNTMNTQTSGVDGIVMDWNGPAGPNLAGEDQMYLLVCLTPPTGGYIPAYNVYCQDRIGFLTPTSWLGVSNSLLFEGLF